MSEHSLRTLGSGECIQKTAIFFCALNQINAGLEYGWTASSFPELLTPRDNDTEAVLTSSESVWVATLPLPGGVVGALANAFLCDLIGRKIIILSSTFPYLIHWIVIAFADTAYIFYIARFLSGISSGIALTTIPMYAGEISNAKIRGRLCGVTPMCLSIGVLIVNVLGLFLTIKTSALACTIFSLTSLLGISVMPESPYFLLMRHKTERAMSSLRILKGREDIQLDLHRIRKTIESQAKTGLKALFTESNRRSLIIIAILRTAQPLCGMTVLVYYCSVILHEIDSLFPVEYATLIFTVALLMSTVFGLVLVDVLGRRPLFLISLVGSFTGITSLGVFFHLKNLKIDVSDHPYVPLVILVWTVLFYGAGVQHIPVVVQSEVFSTGVKASAVSIGLILFSIFSLLASKFFQHLDDNHDSYIAFYTYAVCNFLTFFFVLFFLPETKGITLEEIQLMMKQGKLNFKNVNQEED